MNVRQYIKTHPQRWKILSSAFKLGLFAIGIYVLSRQFPSADWKEASVQLLKQWPVVAIAGLLYFTDQAVMAWRWQVGCRAYHQKVSYPYLLAAQFKIRFLDIITPVPNAEDLFRVHYMRRAKLSTSTSMAVITYDRLIAILSLAMLLPGTFLTFSGLMDPSKTWLLAVGFLLLLIAFLFRTSIGVRVVRWAGKLPFVEERHVSEAETLLQQPVDIRFKLESLSVNLIKVLLSSLVMILLAKAGGASLGFHQILWAIPLFTFSVIIPVSYQGLGLYEAAVILVLPTLGIDESLAISIGVIHFIFNILLISTGGIIYLLDRKTL